MVLVKMCQEKGYVLMLRHPHRRYIGTQIGIYNPAGQKSAKSPTSTTKSGSSSLALKKPS
jgi:hypothetical protein